MALKQWLAGLVMGVSGGFVVLIFPTLGVLLVGLSVIGILRARQRGAGASGFLLGIGTILFVLLLRAQMACQAFDAAPNQGCEAPDITPYVVVAGVLLVAGALGSVVALGRRVGLGPVARPPDPGDPHERRVDGYWIVSIGLVVFGLIAALSIGQPFLMVGLTLIVLRPLRRRPVLFWPPLAAVIAWNVGFLAIAPFQCTAQATTVAPGLGGTSMTTCSSLVGITYVGQGVYNPPLDPANNAALLVAAAAFIVALAAALLLGRPRQAGPVV